MLNTKPDVESFISALSLYRGDMTFNPWGEISSEFTDYGGPESRRLRLALHMDCDAKLILCGEGGGYQGLHWSGIAFTSEKLLADGAIPRIAATGRLCSRPRPWSEPSATIVWRTLYKLGLQDSTTTWNAFPFHPHGPSTELTNRTPNRAEAKLGMEWLRRYAAFFPNAKIVAVGRVAARSVEEAGLELAASVRHPAYGGATAFAEGLSALFPNAKGGARR